MIWRLAVPSATVRYRLTLEALVNGEPKSGSGVIEVTYSKTIGLMSNSGGGGVTNTVVGEAVVVDLGNNDLLVALLADGQNYRSGPDDFIPVLFGLTRHRINISDFHRVAELSGQRDVPFDFLPLMIRLPDKNNSKSAEPFDPFKGASSPRGPITLQRAFAEIVSPGWPFDIWGWTGTPVTRGIKREFPWLVGFNGYLWTPAERDMTRRENRINDGDFVRGF